jgi:hypothetical protein
MGFEIDVDRSVIVPVMKYRILLPPDVDAFVMLRKMRELEEEDPMLNHYKYAKRKPIAAAKYMDNSRNFISLLFQLNHHLIGAIDTMLEEFTEPKEESRGKEPMENVVHTPVYSAGDYISIDPLERETTPVTHGNYFNSSYRGYEGGEESGNNQRSETPIENSTG